MQPPTSLLAASRARQGYGIVHAAPQPTESLDSKILSIAAPSLLALALDPVLAAVDVASAFPDSISDAVSVTYRPSTRAMAMRHSRRARETSSSLLESPAAEVWTAGSSGPGPPGVAMVSPPPPRRARKPDTGGVGGVDDVFVDDLGALFEPVGAPSRRSIIAAAASM